MSIKRLSGTGLTTPKSNKVWDQITFPGTMESIATTVVPSAGASSITFSAITQEFKDLKVIMRSSTGTEINNRLEFNGDTTVSSYYSFGGEGNGSTAYAVGFANTNLIGYDNTTGSTDFCHSIIDILDYSVGTKRKVAYTRSGFERSAPAGTTGWYGLIWSASTNAITQITIKPTSGNFKQYSHFALYGIRG